MIATVSQDARYAARTFAKNPGFAAVVILTLALGIGASTAVFSVFDFVLLRPLPYPDIDRLLSISERTTAGQVVSVSWPDFEDWHDQNQTFAHLGVYRVTTVNLTGGDQPERLNAAASSSEMFGAIGITPLAGRAFGPGEDRADAQRVAIVGERLWRGRFGADRRLVGATIRLDGEPYTVVGVMPLAMRFPSRLTDVWLPLGLSVAGFPPRGAHPGLAAIGRLKPGVTLQQATADLDTIAQRLALQYPDSNKTTRAAPVLYHEQVVQNIRPALLVLLAAVALVLFIGCANLANLMLSKAEGRHREIAVRVALGADRSRIVQQLLVETLMLSSAGGVVGALLASWTVRAFVASRPTSVPRIDQISVDGRVLIFTAATALVTGLVFGLVPALRASSPDLLAALKESARGATRSSRRLRSALVVVEVALAMVLLVGAGLTVRSFSRLISVDPGFDAARVVTARVTLPGATYPDRARWTAFYRELIRRVSNVPGVEAAGLNSAVPLEGGGSEAPVVAEGDPMPGPDHPATPTLFQTISPDYFRAMGIQILEGRSVTERDTADAPPVVVVDETLVRKLFPGRDPIGQRIAFELRGHSATNANPIWREVVGVVRHVHHYGLASEPPFVQLYTSFEQLPLYMQDRRPSMALLVRTTQQPDALAAEVRRALSTLDRNVPLHTVQTMEEYLTQNVEQPRLGVALLGGFGALALLLSVVGIYGVLSYIVSQRTQEMGVRMALGASRGAVLWLVLGQGLRLAALGIVVGLAASFVVTRALTSVLFQVSPHDPATFGLFAAVLAAAALAASAVPALRATRVNPIDALRDE